MVRMRNKCGQDVRDPDLERGLPVRNLIPITTVTDNFYCR